MALCVCLVASPFIAVPLVGSAFCFRSKQDRHPHIRTCTRPFSLSIHFRDTTQCPVRFISGHSNSGITCIDFAPFLDRISRGLFRRESRQSKNSYIRRLQNRPRSTRAHVCTRACARACVRGHVRPGTSRLRCACGGVRRTGHKIPHAFCPLRSRGVENRCILVSQPRLLTIPWSDL